MFTISTDRLLSWAPVVSRRPAHAPRNVELLRPLFGVLKPLWRQLSNPGLPLDSAGDPGQGKST